MIPWFKPNFWGDEKKFVNEALDSTWISDGEFINKFEEQFAKLLNVDHAITVSNGTVALHLALLSLGLGPGDEVIVPAFTFSAPANMVCAVGATPIFADILEDTWCLSPESFKSKISKRTKAVIPVHLYGNVCEMDEILSIAKENNIYVVEDVAEAAFSKYDNKYAGTLGDIGCFSFQTTKTLTMGEGGAIVTNSSELNDKARLFRNHGMRPKKRYWHEVIGYNFRLTNYQAAMGYAQLLKIEDIISNKKRVYALYKEKLSDIKGVKLQVIHDKIDPVMWAFCLVVDSSVLSANEIAKKLFQNNIETRRGFYCLTDMPIYTDNSKAPVANKISNQLISLPSFATLTEEEIDSICSIFIKITNYEI